MNGEDEGVMSGAEFWSTCVANGVGNVSWLAKYLGVRKQSVERWRSGKRAVPRDVASAITGIEDSNDLLAQTIADKGGGYVMDYGYSSEYPSDFYLVALHKATRLGDVHVSWTDEPMKYDNPAAFEDDDEAHARTGDPDTSHEAASHVDVKLQKRMVLDIMSRYPSGISDQTLCKIASERHAMASPQGLRSRRAELTRRGYIERCGNGLTRYNRVCGLYRLSEKGRKMVTAE